MPSGELLYIYLWVARETGNAHQKLVIKFASLAPELLSPAKWMEKRAGDKE